MKLFIAEKPSVAKNIADALKVKEKKDGYFEGNGYLISWAFGHLLELYDAKDYDTKMARWKMDNFPFIPTSFQYKVKSNPRNRKQRDAGAQKQLKIIHSLIRRKDVDAIVSACDYDREGQLIGDSIIYNSKTKKNVYRLLLNEWTPREILRGMENLKPNEEMKPLLNAGISRQWTDWVIGINLTSVATLKFQKGRGKVLNIGRVLLPTLKIIYDRDTEIAQFKPEDYFKLNATFETADKNTYQGTYTEKNAKFKDRAQLEEVQKQIANQTATVTDKQVERKTEYPPFLFNLSNLQGFITNKHKGWTSDKVLKVAQSLYEKKFITYPRTSSTALEESLVGKTAKVLEAHVSDLPYKDEVKFHKGKRVFNNAKVESHSAIIPTYLIPKRLTSDEQLVYTAIKNRFISQFMPAAQYEETTIRTELDQVTLKGYFQTKGKVQIVEGWKKVEKIQSKDTLLPLIEANTTVQLIDSELSTHTTKPPKKHTERTLLRVMESCGKTYKDDESETSEAFMGAILQGFSIGTAATRADTIKKLKDVGYITTEQKNLTCTPLGKKLVESFPITQLFDLEFTGRLEKSLFDMEKRKISKQDFLNEVFGFTTKAVATIKEAEAITIRNTATSRTPSSTKTTTSKESLGKCPECGHSVIEGAKGFGCSNWKSGCSFVLWKNDKFLATLKKRITKTMVKTLLTKGVVYVKGLTSKNGKKFNAYLRYQKNPDNKYFSWKMEFDNGQASTKKAN
ncbi:DNA topoisomerase [Paraliobacillus quinghaiensis]|uniref:DNA topoisomerase n=1 Tax=Paraliobacillus quinghaiensis TaxID=470815 RepID=A0A917TWY0_9BACI|nr:type IA DNA topoisomerase [Paraliobacillus quinghaiensis]GGM42009.1 DNA topoisomerase [Paraliobacillus quinghaiensis]